MRHVWRWGLIGLLLVAACAGGLLRWQAERQPAEPALASPAPFSQAQMASNVAGSPAASRPPSSQLAAGPSQPAAVASQAQSPEDVAQFCGQGQVTQAEFDKRDDALRNKVAGWVQALEQRLGVARSRLAARLAAGTDRQQVAARLMMGDADGAAHIAQRSTDATAYRLALLGCRRWEGDHVPGCRDLTLGTWARLDPQDARPWIDLLAEAQKRRDEAAMSRAADEALQRRLHGSSSPLLEAVFSAGSGVDDAEGLGLLAVEVIGQDAALPKGEALALLKFCSPEGVKDAARRDRCQRLARWQLAQADDLTDAEVGLAIADHVGLPAEQRPFTREQLKRGQAALVEESTRLAGYDCASLRRISAWTARRVQVGELKMALQGAGER